MVSKDLCFLGEKKMNEMGMQYIYTNFSNVTNYDIMNMIQMS